MKAISHLVASTTTSASPVDTKVTGAVSATQEAVQVDRNSTPDTSKRIGLLEPLQLQSETATASEACADWSDDELCVLQVCSEQKGEISLMSPVIMNVTPTVKGRLKAHIAFWERINAPEYILDTIRHGYKIPFLHEPDQMVQQNNNSAYRHKDFVQEAILELLSDNRITEVHKEHLHVINPLSVSVQASGKKRLILDLRQVNKRLVKQKFKFENHTHALAYFRMGCFLTKFDLKSGYHHVDIFPEHRKYLAFAWKFDDGRTRYFMFNVLPFGLATAPYIFTKLLRPLVKLWRTRGLHPVVYLDDGLGMEGSLEAANVASHHTRGDLYAAGFVVAEEKSVWQPVQCIDWIGITWNSKDGCIKICQKRIEKAKRLIKQTIGNFKVTARELASVVGSIISMGVVFGNVVRIMTRHCQISIAAAETWDTQQPLDDYCSLELQFWDLNLKKFNQKNCFQQPINSKIVYSDASSFACGALIQNEDRMLCHKMFTAEEVNYSSTRRELITILYSLQAFGSKLHNCSVKWYTDSQATAKIVEVGSMKTVLQRIAYDIFSHCLENNIDLRIEWIPREFNRQADFISRIRDCDDWQVTQDLFLELNSVWGPYTVDCFSNSYNNKVQKFYSRYWNPGCAGVDALYQSWANENCWLAPPVPIVPRVLQHMSSQITQGTLIVPAWPSSVFWPLLWQRYRENISEFRYYKGKDCCLHGRNTKSVIGAPTWDGYIIAVKLNFA